MNVSVSALSAFLMTTFVCGKHIGGGGCCWINGIHTYNATPVYYGGSVRQGIHKLSCSSVATDKGDVLRPLLIQHSSKGLRILYLLSPHNRSGLGATHTWQSAHTHANKTGRKQRSTQTSQHEFSKHIHIFSLLNHKHAHRHTDTICVIPRLTELKQMKELVNEIWLNSLKCSTASISRTKRQYFSKLPQ